MKYIILTLSITGEKVLINIKSIVFSVRIKSDESDFTRIFVNQIHIPKTETGYIDVQETIEEIYKQLNKR